MDSVHYLMTFLEAKLTATLEDILEAKNNPYTNTRMNYPHYEDKIVKPLGVVLDGWPIEGSVCNPGLLSRNDGAILENALCNNRCKWVILSPDELAARKASSVEMDVVAV
jgi:hypothetical protein